MAKYVEPVYDRSAADIAARNSKAHFNVADWVRIYNNSIIAATVIEFFTGTPITPNGLNAPDIATLPDIDELNSLAENIEMVRAASGFPVSSDMPVVKTDWAEGAGSDSIDYEDVNTWERILAILMNEYARLTYYRVYCGVSTAGQPRFYQNRWRVILGGVPESATPVRRTRMNVGDCGTGLKRTNMFRRYD